MASLVLPPVTFHMDCPEDLYLFGRLVTTLSEVEDSLDPKTGDYNGSTTRSSTDKTNTVQDVNSSPREAVSNTPRKDVEMNSVEGEESIVETKAGPWGVSGVPQSPAVVLTGVNRAEGSLTPEKALVLLRDTLVKCNCYIATVVVSQCCRS